MPKKSALSSATIFMPACCCKATTSPDAPSIHLQPSARPALAPHRPQLLRSSQSLFPFTNKITPIFSTTPCVKCLGLPLQSRVQQGRFKSCGKCVLLLLILHVHTQESSLQFKLLVSPLKYQCETWVQVPKVVYGLQISSTLHQHPLLDSEYSRISKMN